MRKGSLRCLTLKEPKALQLNLAIKTPQVSKNKQNTQKRTLSGSLSCKNIGQKTNKKVRNIDLRFTASRCNSIKSSNKNTEILRELDPNDHKRHLDTTSQYSASSTSKKISYRQTPPSCFSEFNQNSCETDRKLDWEEIINKRKETLNSYLYKIDKKLIEYQREEDLSPLHNDQHSRISKKTIDLRRSHKETKERKERKESGYVLQKQLYQRGKQRTKKRSINLVMIT